MEDVHPDHRAEETTSRQYDDRRPVGAQTRTVLISGNGVAGPTLAYWLGVRGFTPTLVERAPQLRTGGYVIDFWGLGYDIADKMNLLPDIAREGYDMQELRFVDAHGARVGGFDASVFKTLTNGRYVSLARSDLARLIYAKVADRHEVIFGDSIAGIAQDGDGVDVTFEHASPRRFDLVVGADGLHSNVRRLAFGAQDQFERPLGCIVGAFEAQGYRPRDDGAYVSYSVPGKQIARFAMREDRTLFLFVVNTDDMQSTPTDDPAGQKALLRTTFADAGWESPQILDLMDACDDVYFDRVSQIRMPAWSKGRSVLVGDAAYCPSLMAGQGAALAMTGAYVLAGELARDDGASPSHALQRYEALLRPFLSSKQALAENFARSFVPQTQFGLFVRNQATKIMAVPGLARLMLGRTLLDNLTLPDYPAPTR
jgi:2-polyprenyl-6-methoxyphenol hydroxylase-like FAD-dependent oxidoreductase